MRVPPRPIEYAGQAVEAVYDPYLFGIRRPREAVDLKLLPRQMDMVAVVSFDGENSLCSCSPQAYNEIAYVCIFRGRMHVQGLQEVALLKLPDARVVGASDLAPSHIEWIPRTERQSPTVLLIEMHRCQIVDIDLVPLHNDIAR